MTQGRRSALPRSNLPRLTGRMSPQQSFKKVGPAISEALRTSVRPRNRTDVPTNQKQQQQQKFRPNSGADAILCLDEGAIVDDVTEEVEMDLRTGEGGVRPFESMKGPLPTTKSALPRFARPGVKQQPLSNRVVTPETKSSGAQASGIKGTVKAQPSAGLLINRQPNYTRNRRVSKALPSLPPPTPSPCRASFAPPPKPSKDVFYTNRAKVLRGQGAPVVSSPSSLSPVAPRMSGNCDTSSGSSYDSAEQTWNMINGLMSAVGEEEVRRARESIIQMPGSSLRKPGEVRRGGGGCVKFPRMEVVKEGSREGDEWNSNSEGYSSSDSRTYRTSSISSTISSSSSTLISSGLHPDSGKWQDFTKSKQQQQHQQQQQQHQQQHFSDTFPRLRTRTNNTVTIPSLKRRTSASSVFSIVIQPTRERSHEVQDALVLEDDLPLRIRGILQCNHHEGEGYDSGLCSKSYSTSSSEEGGEGVELHPDLLLTIDTLRTVQVQEIVFT